MTYEEYNENVASLQKNFNKFKTDQRKFMQNSVRNGLKSPKQSLECKSKLKKEKEKQ